MAEARCPDALLASCALSRIECRALLAVATGRDRGWLIAHGDEALDENTLARFHQLVGLRQAGMPIAYLSGEREFFGRSFEVNDSVLIPRPETEGLVEWAISLPGPRVLDLGTGSGAVAVSIALACPSRRVEATDLDPTALEVARRNAARLGARIERWHCGDWWSALPDGSQYDLVVSNPPYIAQSDPHLNQGDLPAEPANALVSGPQGLDAIHSIIDGAFARLAPGAWLLIEHGYDQASEVARLMLSAGLVDACNRPDLAGIERLTGARRP